MKKSLLVLAPLLLIFPGLVSAEVITPETSTILRSQHQDLTPTERIMRDSARGIKPHSEKYIRLSTRYDESIVDASLASLVLTTLREDPVLSERPMRLKVVSKNRVVRLEGVVNDQAEKTLVAKRVAEIGGVDKVENFLRIKRSNRDLLEG